jgi:predicted nucleic acid-binding protein
MYCIDASVLINSVIVNEEFHEYSKGLPAVIKEREIMVVVPEIVLPEIASAISRGTGDPYRAIAFTSKLRQLPNFIFSPIDSSLADLSSKLAAIYKLRGCDSTYVAVASLFNAKLVSLDKQRRKGALECIEALTPMEELKNLGEI